MFDRKLEESDIIVSKDDVQSFVKIANEIKLESLDKFIGQIDDQYNWRNMKISVIYTDIRKSLMYMIYIGWRRILINFISAIVAVIAYPIVVFLFVIDKVKYYGVNRRKVKERIADEITTIVTEDLELLSSKELWSYCDLETYKACLDKFEIVIEYDFEDKSRILDELNSTKSLYK